MKCKITILLGVIMFMLLFPPKVEAAVLVNGGVQCGIILDR